MPVVPVVRKKRKEQPKKQESKAPAALWAVLPLALLAALTSVAYASSLHGKFVFDDQQIVFQNPALMNIRTFSDVVSLGAGWRQLLFFTYGLNFYWTGLDASSYHILNVALHVVNVILVYWIILAALGRGKGESSSRPEARHSVPMGEGFIALAGAAVFGVHTLLSSAVSYIAGRSSVLCATFYFTAILLFFKGLDSPRRATRAMYFVLTGVAGLFAWQAKQEAIALPLFLAGVSFLRTEKKDWRWIAPLAAIPFLVVLLIRDQIAALYATVGGNQVLVSAGFEKVLQPATYFRTYLTSVVGYYLPRFVFPASLSADPQIAPAEHWYSPEFIVSIGVLALLAWVTLRFYKR